MKRQILMVSLALLVVATAAFAGLHTRSGWVYIQNSQWKEAVRELLLAVEEDPKDAKAQFGLGLSYSNLDSVALAYKHFTITKELDPKKAKDCDNNIQSNYARHYKSGQTAFSQVNYPTAAREFELATYSDPKQSGAHYNLAVAYSRLAQSDSTYYAKALAEADMVLELADPKDPNYERALQLAANQLVYLGKPEEAMERMRKTIEEDPTKYEIVETMGNDLMQRHKWAGAASFLKLSAEARATLGAEDAKLLYNIGECEYSQRKDDPAHLDEAIIYYEKAANIQGDDPNTALKLLMSYAAKKDFSNAALYGEKYVLLAPSDPNGWQLLSSCYNELGEDDKAAEALARYSTLKGGQ